MTFTDATGASVTGTSAASMSDAIKITFVYQDSSWYIKTPKNYYVYPHASSNGKLVVTSTKTAVTLEDANQNTNNNAPAGYIAISNGGRYIQKNKTGAQFGSYGNTANNVTLIEAPLFGSLDHVKVTTQPNITTFFVGETYSRTGLALTGYDGAVEASANTQSYTSGFTTDFDGHVFDENDIGEQTVTVTYSGKTATYSILVYDSPDFVHTYSSNSIFGSTSANAVEIATHTPEDSGPEYITLGGYNYTGGTAMSLTSVSGMYFGNNEEYEISSVKKYIGIIIIATSSDVSGKVQMTEGPTALSEETIVSPILRDGNKTLIYEFSGETQFFKFKSTAASYINIKSIRVYLGATVVDAEVDTVSATVSDITRLTGSHLTASDFNVTVTWTAGKSDTHPLSGFTWKVGGVLDGALAEGDNAVIVIYEGVESDEITVIGTTPHATAVSVEESTATIGIGESITLHGSIAPANAVETIVWSSNRENIARISNTGIVTGVAAGTATITATAGSYTDTCEITVTTNKTIFINDANLLNYSGSNIAYSADVAESAIDGLSVESFGCGAYGNGIQMRTDAGTGTSTIYNASATPLNKLEFKWANSQNVSNKDYHLYVDFSNVADFSELVGTRISVQFNSSTKLAEATPVSSATYFRVVHAGQGTVYLGSLTVVLNNIDTHLGAATSIKSVRGTETAGVVSDVSLNFGLIIPKTNWNAIHSERGITQYGVKLVKQTTLTSTYSKPSIAAAYYAEQTLADIHASGSTPYETGDNYAFTVRVNILSADDYDTVYCAVPYIIAGGRYYFFAEMRYSVNTLAEYCLANGDSNLSNEALSTLLA